MSNEGFAECEFPLGGGAQRRGGEMTNEGFAECEFPLEGKARSAKGAR